MLKESNKWAISATSVGLMALAYLVMRFSGIMQKDGSINGWWLFLIIVVIFFAMYGFMNLDWQSV